MTTANSSSDQQLRSICDCDTKSALVCKQNPDCRPSYCKMRLFDPPITVSEAVTSNERLATRVKRLLDMKLRGEDPFIGSMFLQEVLNALQGSAVETFDEPTQEMIEAGKDERMRCFDEPTLSVGAALSRIYRAMRSAKNATWGS